MSEVSKCHGAEVRCIKYKTGYRDVVRKVTICTVCNKPCEVKEATNG